MAGGLVIKPKRDEDFYIAWSTVCDAPTWWGTRAKMADYLLRHSFPCKLSAVYAAERSAAQGQIEERLARVDRRGTSSFLGDGAWDEDEFLLGEDGFRCDGGRPHLLKRADARAFCETKDRKKAHRMVCEKARRA